MKTVEQIKSEILGLVERRKVLSTEIKTIHAKEIVVRRQTRSTLSKQIKNLVKESRNLHQVEAAAKKASVKLAKEAQVKAAAELLKKAAQPAPQTPSPAVPA